MPPSSDVDDPEEREDSALGQLADSSTERDSSDESEPEMDQGESETEQEESETEESDLESVEIQEAEEVTIEEAGEERPDESATILHVLLEGLHVNLLGLEIHLPELDLDVSAVPGEKRLLGNLLSQVAGLVDGLAGGGSSLLSGVRGLLGKLSPRSILGGLWRRLSGLVPFVGGGSEEESSGDEDGETEDEAGDSEGEAADSDGDEESDESSESGGGLVRSIGSRLRSMVTSLLPSIPVERVVTWLVQTGLKRLVDAVDERSQRRSEESDDAGDGDSKEQAAATDGGWSRNGSDDRPLASDAHHVGGRP